MFQRGKKYNRAPECLNGRDLKSRCLLLPRYLFCSLLEILFYNILKLAQTDNTKQNSRLVLRMDVLLVDREVKIGALHGYFMTIEAGLMPNPAYKT